MTAREAKDRSRGVSEEMSSDLIARRLEIVSELREWCAFLATAQRLAPVPQTSISQDLPTTSSEIPEETREVTAPSATESRSS